MTLVNRVATRFMHATASNNCIPPRLNLTSHDGEYLVWLEGPGGTRVFVPDKPMPAEVLHELYAMVLRDRARIEAAWVHDVMVPNRWLDIAVSQDVATIIAYPGMVTAFRRELDLTAWADALGLEEFLMAQVDPTTSDIILISENGSRATIPIWSVLWVNDTDPSLASHVPDEHLHGLVVPF